MVGSLSTHREISRVISPLLLGIVFNWMLYGVLCVQTYVYSYNFTKDRRLLKFTVYFIFALETAQTALTGADAYYWFVGGFGQVERLRNAHFLPIDVFIICAVIQSIVLSYLCYRIWMLSGNLWVCTAITITIVTGVTGAAWAGFASLPIKEFAIPKAAVYLWSIASTLTNLMIATAITLLIRKSHGIEGSLPRFFFVRVVRLTVETNILTTSVVIATLILFVAFPNELYYLLPAATIGKLYSNTLLVNLNNRIYFRDHASGSRSTRVGDSSGSHGTSTTQGRTTTVGSLHFIGAESQLEAHEGESCKQGPITHTVDLEKGNGDSGSTNSDPSHVPGVSIHVKTTQTIA